MTALFSVSHKMESTGTQPEIFSEGSGGDRHREKMIF
jgi:hypothetical protein